MGLNLHSLVRPAIGSVNPDISATYRQSLGKTTLPSGKTAPTYTDFPLTTIQVQAMSASDLRHPDFVNVQGVKRKVYMFGNTQGVNRPDAKGGDILVYPEVTGGTARTWLVVVVFESWSPDVASWCSLGVVLQND